MCSEYKKTFLLLFEGYIKSCDYYNKSLNFLNVRRSPEISKRGTETKNFILLYESCTNEFDCENVLFIFYKKIPSSRIT